MRLDNPSLTIRKPDRPVSPLKEQPWRIILTHDASSIPADSICLTDEFRDRTLVVENVFNYLELLKNYIMIKNRNYPAGSGRLSGPGISESRFSRRVGGVLCSHHYRRRCGRRSARSVSGA